MEQPVTIETVIGMAVVIAFCAVFLAIGNETDRDGGSSDGR